MNKQKGKASKSLNVGGTNFLVTIHHQDNHSWQGVIQWLDTGKTIHFRSALEMLTLMEQAVALNDENREMRTWESEKAIKAI